MDRNEYKPVLKNACDDGLPSSSQCDRQGVQQKAVDPFESTAYAILVVIGGLEPPTPAL
jgi:hypothetical protein